MDSIDFLHLMSIAKRKEAKKGEVLISNKKFHNCIHFVNSGKLSVVRGNDEKLSDINRDQFVGAMSFLSWWSKQDSLDEENEIIKKEKGFHDKIYELPLEELIIQAKQVHFYWPSFQVGLDSDDYYMSIMNEIDNPDSNNDDNSDNNVYNNNNSNSNNKWYSNFVNIGNKTEIISDEDKGELGQALVTAEEDCILYTWDFDVLRDKLILEPSLAFTFEQIMTSDINKKMTTNLELIKLEREKERSIRFKELKTEIYRNLVIGALLDEELTDREKKALENERKKNDISNEDHVKIVNDLGWTIEEFKVGIKKNPALDQYKLMLLASMDVNSLETSYESRCELRKYRKKNNISHDNHVKQLLILGLTEDEYDEILSSCEKKQLEKLSSGYFNWMFPSKRNEVDSKIEMKKKMISDSLINNRDIDNKNNDSNIKLVDEMINELRPEKTTEINPKKKKKPILNWMISKFNNN
jgi:hypothetical protein